MSTLFYVAGIVAVIATLMVITRTNTMHALVYLIVALLAVASIFYTLGASFAAALQVIVYAGAIMVLFVFAVMLLNLGPVTEQQERAWLSPGVWAGPGILAALLLIQFIATLSRSGAVPSGMVVAPKSVGISLFTTYLVGVELASLLLLAGLVAAFHFGVMASRLLPPSPEEARPGRPAGVPGPGLEPVTISPPEDQPQRPSGPAEVRHG